MENKKIKRLAIIPARGGSKRIPRKNIKDFLGKPIIIYPLRTLKNSGLFDDIHVSTEDVEIFDIVKKNGFEPKFFRDESLSGDLTPTLPVLRYVVEQYEKLNLTFDEIWLVNPCSPLIDVDDLRKAAQIYNSRMCNCALLAVSELPIPLEWAYTINSDEVLVPFMEGEFAKRSQDLSKAYYDTGTFAIFSRDIIVNSSGAGINEKFIGYRLPKNHSIDIDDLEDWDLAEDIYFSSANRNK